ncbi:glycosyltransferase [Nitratireductor sp. ZSWI3]|uniref:glycosyltransferase n=1 Tax=Nitratireductor sp. ZSWI3 TaxID=2966359 RepID=UPI0021503707|nr:glycosyltransferase [Nitratireductor sp. ZSWI3]MCR4268244.1 glycosyltransferase [Nitratireductor sp. ZSWI3]
MSEIEPKAWVDVTGVIRWGAQPPTGIQRVETTVCRQAFETSTAGFVIFDVLARRYRRLTQREMAFLAYIVLGKWPADTAARGERLKGAFAYLDVQFSHQDNETARRLAYAATGFRRRSGGLYTVAKLVLRLFQWLFVVLRSLMLGASAVARRISGRPQRWAPEGSVVLVSHEVSRNRSITDGLDQAGLHGVNIVHDLIPVLQPELVSKRFSAGMDTFLRRILKAPEPIIAVSRSTRDDLIMWNRDDVGAAYPFEIKVCPLGSALVSTQRDNEPIPGLEGRPFSVFCSTFDIRKNHHLLVAVWAWLARNMDIARLPDLVLIGRRGNASGLVEAELAKAPELAGRVHILSGISDKQLRWGYQNAVLGLFPSSAEGWGLGVSECLASGLPVVHADVPSLKEAAQDLMPVLPAGDFDAWSTTLKDLFEHPEKIEALRSRVAETYDRGSPAGFAGCVISYLNLLADKGLGAARVQKQQIA